MPNLRSECVPVKFRRPHDLCCQPHQPVLPDSFRAAALPRLFVHPAPPVPHLPSRGGFAGLALPAESETAVFTFYSGSKRRVSAVSARHVLPHPAPLPVFVFLCPTVFFCRGLPYYFRIHAVLEIKMEFPSFADYNGTDTLFENILIKLSKPHRLRTGFPQDRLRDILGAASPALSLGGAADPVHSCVPVSGAAFRPVFPLAADKAASALSAFQHTGKTGGVQRLVRKWPHLLPAGHLLLHIPEGFHINNGFVCPFHIILRQLAFILLPLFRDGVFNVLLLEQKVPCIGDVGQHDLDIGIHPSAPLCRGDPLGGKFTLRFQAGLSVKEVLEDTLYDLGLLRLDHKPIPFPPVAVNSEAPVWDSLLKTFAGPPFHIVADGAALLLRKRCKDGQHQLAVPAHGTDVFLLESHFNAQVFQMPDSVQKVYRVPGKTADGLGQDNIYLPLFAVLHHLPETAAFCRPSAADPVITLCQEQDLKNFIFLLKKQTRASLLKQRHPCSSLSHPILEPSSDMRRPSFRRLCQFTLKTSD